jgi:glycosyltransferase involved in cell wall biosynthesis
MTPFVVFGDEWGSHPTSVQYLARGLASTHPLLYVNTPWLRRPRWNINDAQRAWRKVRQWALPRDNHSSGRFYSYSPAVIPFKPFGPVRRWNRNMLVKGLRRQLRLHNLEAPALFVAQPLAAETLGTLGERLLVYYITDQYAAMPGVYSQYVEDLERTLLSEANLIFVTSTKLQQEKNGRKAHALMLPHGVDFEHFYSATKLQGSVPEELRHLPRPLLGFYGLLAPWVDANLLRHVARAFPKASVVLIGPVWIDFPLPKDVSNLYWFGARSYADLPHYAAQFDVGLIPFRQDLLTAYVNPLKLLEYLALGLPVVSTPLPDLARFGDLVYQASSPDDFIDQVKLALADRSPERSAQRLTLAAGESWDARVNTLQEQIERALSVRHETVAPHFSLGTAPAGDSASCGA